MSNRTLFEINHDFADRIEDPLFVVALRRYLASARSDTAENLEPYGVRVLGMRHHSGNYVLEGTPDGFPPQYLERAK